MKKKLLFEEDVITPNFSSFWGSPPGELTDGNAVCFLPTNYTVD